MLHDTLQDIATEARSILGSICLPLLDLPSTTEFTLLPAASLLWAPKALSSRQSPKLSQSHLRAVNALERLQALAGWGSLFHVNRPLLLCHRCSIHTVPVKADVCLSHCASSTELSVILACGCILDNKVFVFSPKLTRERPGF